MFDSLRPGRTAPDCSKATFAQQLEASGTVAVRRVSGDDG
jgi:hypothetical protein